MSFGSFLHVSAVVIGFFHRLVVLFGGIEHVIPLFSGRNFANCLDVVLLVESRYLVSTF